MLAGIFVVRLLNSFYVTFGLKVRTQWMQRNIVKTEQSKIKYLMSMPNKFRCEYIFKWNGFRWSERRSRREKKERKIGEKKGKKVNSQKVPHHIHPSIIPSFEPLQLLTGFNGPMPSVVRLSEPRKEHVNPHSVHVDNTLPHSHRNGLEFGKHPH